jgi:hypothetical protein
MNKKTIIFDETLSILPIPDKNTNPQTIALSNSKPQNFIFISSNMKTKLKQKIFYNILFGNINIE